MNHHIILASQSPRRQELLRGLDIPFTVKTIKGLQENYPPTLSPEEVPEYLAKQKSAAYKTLLKPNTLILTADTVVIIDGKVLGKPHNESEARHMLHLLAGRTHKVVTGVCITGIDRQCSFSATTDVTFGTLTDNEINYYVSKYHPFDKAGSYGVQEWIGYMGVERISGSFYNVMGLPVQRLYQLLKHWDKNSDQAFIEQPDRN